MMCVCVCTKKSRIILYDDYTSIYIYIINIISAVSGSNPICRIINKLHQNQKRKMHLKLCQIE